MRQLAVAPRIDKLMSIDAVARSMIDAVRRHRRWWLISATLLFFVGCFISLRQLDFDFSDIRALPAALIFFVMSPLALAYGGIGLLLLSRGAGHHLSFAQAFRVNCGAQLAEILPIPGGAIVRTGALVAAGAGTGKSVALVALGAVLWVAVAASGAVLALLSMTGDDRFAFVGLAVAVVLVATLFQLVRLAGVRVTIALGLHRVIGCLITAARVALAFAAIGAPMPIATAFVFSLATIAGSAASIAPAGLGLSELFGAAIATAIGVDPFVAFLAIAVNRLLGLLANGAIFAAIERPAVFKRPPHAE